jgi:hypothetical protein
MTKEKLVVKSVRFPDALSHRCMGLTYVARPTLLLCIWSPVSWMTWLSGKALSHLRRESSVLQLWKLVKLKDKALVNGRSGEKKSVTINKR